MQMHPFALLLLHPILVFPSHLDPDQHCRIRIKSLDQKLFNLVLIDISNIFSLPQVPDRSATLLGAIAHRT